jgi:4-hydroxybenzoate polyprenyltransferase
LIRFPNVFTTPSDILVGYFSTTSVPVAGAAEIMQLIALMISSGLLYVAGIVLNDYFDTETDKRERPFRPLPSGNIQSRDAIIIALGALGTANIIAFAIGPASLAISIMITVTIFAYDYWLKHGIAGPFAMGGARFLNVIFGASPAISAALVVGHVSVNGVAFLQLQIVTFAAASLFAYVTVITILSKNETKVINQERTNLFPFSIVCIIIALIIAIDLLLGGRLKWSFLVNLLIFVAIMIITFKPYIALSNIHRKKKSERNYEDEVASTPSIQKTIRNMVISIIVLDSVFVSGTGGLVYGLATLLLIAPTIILAKKMYMT